jgi:hypothetical protein
MPPHPVIFDYSTSQSPDFGTLDTLTRTWHGARATFAAHRSALLRVVGERVFGLALPAALGLVYARRVAETNINAAAPVMMIEALPLEENLNMREMLPAFVNLSSSVLHCLSETAKKLETIWFQKSDPSLAYWSTCLWVGPRPHTDTSLLGLYSINDFKYFLSSLNDEHFLLSRCQDAYKDDSIF